MGDHTHRRRNAAIGIGLTVTIVAGVLAVRAVSAPDFGIESAPDAGHPRCAQVARSYPEKIAGSARAATDLPGVTVWGDADVVLRCGAPVPSATVDPCVNVDGVDWVVDESRSKDGHKVLITYGREPAVELTVTDAAAHEGAGLVDLSHAIEPIRQGSPCI
ncbi:DUF3515 family protein [Streptomyces boluensis]|uniref:DUF3515 family protein n=1 Tax=Streptomyces boluensis TaxID=1775135 RepID=A0A964UVP2_9ACTN|nr:DUF3515 family protein [Streptomyces boluensis]NBE55220.1 DUF3515 family protein [Streptomyces boluensis]